MNYQDLILEISSTADGGYEIRVDGPAGSRSEIVRPQVAAAAEPEREGEEPIDPRRRRGEKLFRALFTGAVGEAYQRSTAALEALQANDPEMGLRLKLVFGAPARVGIFGNRQAQRDLVRFASLPWEQLCDPDASQPLALDAATSLVRTFGVDSLAPTTPIQGTLRVLLVSSGPCDLETLDLQQEEAAIRQCLQGQHMVEVEPLENPDFTALRQKLAESRAEPFHVLHFLGHGGFNANKGEGHLCLVNRRTRCAERVPGPTFAGQLASRGLRLVVLNACRGAQVPRQLDDSPFGSVAVALLGAGIPAVVGMQQPISDPAAIAFARDFYGSLRSHGWVETAVTDARQGVQGAEAEGAGADEWAVPALYLHPRAGQLVDFDNSGAALRAAGAPVPLKLGLRSWDGWGQTQMKECDWVLNLAPEFQQRFLRVGAGENLIAKWDRAIFQKLHRFVTAHLEEGRPIEVHLAAHLSIAFALGFLLDARSGLDLSFVQRGQQQGTAVWKAGEGEVPPLPLWSVASPIERDPQAQDEALVISVTNDALRGTTEFLDAHPEPAVRCLHHATLSGGPLHSALASGAHACKAAQYLEQERAKRDKRPPEATLHIFASAPGTFLFYLGQLAGPWRKVQLYEWDFQQQRVNATYEPSILLDARTYKPLRPKSARQPRPATKKK